MGCDDISDAQRAWFTDPRAKPPRPTLMDKLMGAQKELQDLFLVMMYLDEWMADPESRILSTRLQDAVRKVRGY